MACGSSVVNSLVLNAQRPIRHDRSWEGQLESCFAGFVGDGGDNGFYVSEGPKPTIFARSASPNAELANSTTKDKKTRASRSGLQ